MSCWAEHSYLDTIAQQEPLADERAVYTRVWCGATWLIISPGMYYTKPFSVTPTPPPSLPISLNNCFLFHRNCCCVVPDHNTSSSSFASAHPSCGPCLQHEQTLCLQWLDAFPLRNSNRSSTTYCRSNTTLYGQRYSPIEPIVPVTSTGVGGAYSERLLRPSGDLQATVKGAFVVAINSGTVGVVVS